MMAKSDLPKCEINFFLKDKMLYSNHLKNRPFGNQMAIFQTQFVSRKRMVPTIRKPDWKWNGPTNLTIFYAKEKFPMAMAAILTIQKPDQIFYKRNTF
jgi:hypothetical protein